MSIDRGSAEGFVTCNLCGFVADGKAVKLDRWTTVEGEDGRRVDLCPDCARKVYLQLNEASGT